MKLLAISDLHLGHEPNRQALQAVPDHPEDWLVLVGDVGETVAHLDLAFRTLCPRFRQIIWVPGNHELWTRPGDHTGLRGEAHYLRLVSQCRSFGVLTPEDPFPIWTGEGPRCVLAPLFLLYDYSFRPDEVPLESAVAWALAGGILCADERFLHPDPYRSRAEWCRERCRLTEERLAALRTDLPTVLLNHFPLRRELADRLAIPHFSPWCGTRTTEDWHLRFRALAVVSGHLHLRSTRWRDAVRFEEVSLGYPRQWHRSRGIQGYLREILPGPAGGRTDRRIP